MNIRYIFLTILIAIYAFTLMISYNVVWVSIIMLAGIVYGVLGNIVAIRRLYFLASATPHVALLAVALSIPSVKMFGGYEIAYSLIYGLLMTYIVGYMIHRGVEPDRATSLMVGASASLTVLTVYYVMVKYPVEFSLTALIMGDPLLATWRDLYIMLIITLVTIVFFTLTIHEQLSIGIDRESTYLSGVKVWFYDLVAYTMIGLGAIALLPITGYILEHVLILLPPGIAVMRGGSAKESIYSTIFITISASLFGLQLSILFDQSPTGMIGLILLAIYIIVYVGGKL